MKILNIAIVSLLGLVAINANVFEYNNTANQAVTAAARAKGSKKPSSASKGSKAVSKSSDNEDCRGAKAKSSKSCNPSSEPSTTPASQQPTSCKGNEESCSTVAPIIVCCSGFKCSVTFTGKEECLACLATGQGCAANVQCCSGSCVGSFCN